MSAKPNLAYDPRLKACAAEIKAVLDKYSAGGANHPSNARTAALRDKLAELVIKEKHRAKLDNLEVLVSLCSAVAPVLYAMTHGNKRTGCGLVAECISLMWADVEHLFKAQHEASEKLH